MNHPPSRGVVMPLLPTGRQRNSRPMQESWHHVLPYSAEDSTYAEYDQRGEMSSDAYTTDDANVWMLTRSTMPKEGMRGKIARGDAKRGPEMNMKSTPTSRRGAKMKVGISVSRAAPARGRGPKVREERCMTIVADDIKVATYRLCEMGWARIVGMELPSLDMHQAISYGEHTTTYTAFLCRRWNAESGVQRKGRAT